MGKKGPLWWRESDWLLRGSSAANQILLHHSGPILSKGVGGGGTQRGTWRGYVEGVCRGGMWRGMQRGTWRGYTEEICRGGMWSGAWRGVQRWLPLATINLVGDNREFEV